MLDACLADELPPAIALSEELIGLGEGLSPSGDDFVGGLLYTVHRLRAVYAGLSRLEPDDLNAILHCVESRTNLISFTLLQDQSRGHTSHALRLLVDGLLGGKPCERIRALAAKLTRTGSSTGWDLLTGVAVGMMAVCGVFAARKHGRERDACRLRS